MILLFVQPLTTSMETFKCWKIITSFSSWMIILLLSPFGIRDCVTDNATLLNPNDILKTIKSEDGDVIDCVDILKQPALSHPLLANHTLQMKPNIDPIGIKSNGSSKSWGSVEQTWHKNGEYCPKGTIPIARYQVKSPHKKTHPSALEVSVTEAKYHEHAQVTQIGENYYGGTAKFNVWTPVTIAPDLSLAQMWVLTGDGPNLNSVEAGWMVDGSKTRLFTFWTSDGYRSTGCYNLECPGFVQTSSKITPGSPVVPISIYGGNQFDISINIQKDMTSGNWWLRIQGEDVGYWPSNLFHGSGLSTYSTAINWGGEITNTNPQGLHTQTDMGSGHFASEGINKSAYIMNMGYVDQVGNVKDAHDLIPYATRADCYSVEVQDRDEIYGVYIFYGGPGYSPSCKT